jgi:hypothetical protein
MLQFMERDERPCKPTRRGSNEFLPATVVESTCTSRRSVKSVHESKAVLFEYVKTKNGKPLVREVDRWSSLVVDKAKQRHPSCKSQSTLTPRSPQYPPDLSFLTKDLPIMDRTRTSPKTAVEASKSRDRSTMRKSRSCPDRMRSLTRRHSSSSSSTPSSPLPTIEEFHRADCFEVGPTSLTSVQSLPCLRTIPKAKSKPLVLLETSKKVRQEESPQSQSKSQKKKRVRCFKSKLELSLLVRDNEAFKSCLVDLAVETKNTGGRTPPRDRRSIWGERMLSNSMVKDASMDDLLVLPPRLPGRSKSPEPIR